MSKTEWPEEFEQDGGLLYEIVEMPATGKFSIWHGNRWTIRVGIDNVRYLGDNMPTATPAQIAAEVNRRYQFAPLAERVVNAASAYMVARHNTAPDVEERGRELLNALQAIERVMPQADHGTIVLSDSPPSVTVARIGGAESEEGR